MWPRTVSIPMTFSMFLQSLAQKFWRSRAKMEQDSITALTLLFFHGVGNTTDRLPGLCPAGTFILKWLIHGAWESIYGSEISFTYFTETWKRSTDLCFHYRVSFHSQHSKKLCRIGETPSILGEIDVRGFHSDPAWLITRLRHFHSSTQGDTGLSWGQIALFALLQPNTSLGVARVAAQFLPEVGGRNCSAKQGFAVAKRMRNWCFARKFLETTKGFHF